MNSTRLLFVTFLILVLAGCASFRNARHHKASSVVQFLYPDVSQPFVEPTIPTLRLPLRVGVAFVPPASEQAGVTRYANFSEAQKNELMRQISASFKALPFVQSIEILPATYLRPGGGFQNLDQIRSLLGVDVVALVSYDQAQNTSDTAWSLAYWTIVGAYVVPAQKNDTHTLMEAVVYDIASRNLLFRAPGVSAIKGHSTFIRSDDELRADSARSLTLAVNDLTIKLQSELDAFKARVKEKPESVRIEHKAGYSGAGLFKAWFAGLLAIIFAISRWHRCAVPASSLIT